jgi:hypothetical protein
MSDDEEDYDSEDEEEDFDEDEEDEEEGEGEDAEALKKEALAGDIATLLDVFGYIDRTTRRITSRLESDSKLGNRGKKKGLGTYVSSSANPNMDASAGGTKTRGTPVTAGDELMEGRELEEGGDLIGGWSQYENMNDADRGMLLEKAILALGIDDD